MPLRLLVQVFDNSLLDTNNSNDLSISSMDLYSLILMAEFLRGFTYFINKCNNNFMQFIYMFIYVYHISYTIYNISNKYIKIGNN